MGIPDNEGMSKMFRALESTGLRGFLVCPSILYEQDFARVFELPTEGLTNLSEVPKDLVFNARSLVSRSGEPIKTSCKKREMKYEFRLLNDILAKSVTFKAGSFDAVTHERFLLMTTIHFELKVNWIKLLFGILKEMADKSSKRAKGYAAQICVLLKGDPAVTLGEAKTFPPLKILTAKTVGTYVAKQKGIDDGNEGDEPVMASAAVVKKKPVTKKRTAPTTAEPIAKKKMTTVGRAAPTKENLAMVTVAQEVVPIQMGSDDEREPDVVEVVGKERETTVVDDVDQIIVQVIDETAQMDTDVEEPAVVTETAEMVIDAMMVETASVTTPEQFLKEPLRSREDDDMSGFKQPSKIIETEKKNEKNKETDIEPVETEKEMEQKPALMDVQGQILEKVTDSEDTEPLSKALELIEKPSLSDEESMSIDDILKRIPDEMMLPSVTADEPTRIKFGLGIEINGVKEMDWYTASLPKIAADAKGKKPLENQTPLRRLATLESVKDIAVKEEQVLTWAETDSVQITLQRRMYIVAKALAIRGTVRDLEVDPTDFCGVFRRGLDVQLISSDSSSSSTHPNPDSLSTSSSSASPMDFIDDIPKLEQSPAVFTQISMPTADVTTPDFTESFAQLRASVNQIQFEQVQTRDDVEKLKDVLLLHIRGLERRFTEISDQQDRAYRGLFTNVRQEVQQILESRRELRTRQAVLSTKLDIIRKDVQDQKAALSNDLMEFCVQAQKNFNTLTFQLSELVDYINRGGDAKKGKEVAAKVRRLQMIDPDLVLETVVETEAVGVNLLENEVVVVLTEEKDQEEIGDIGLTSEQV
ncbi:phragmoplast orienting kinesin 1-like [Dorcoceras hygrometricum]|uniref:Phragmoplast orienting kinesin 1-like n=1 Tax=Dorcoceras hygrometricum TaxID=472368 RepID=A0A2Z7C866_9LAMI|nr:phragmoplast orienting kinesin 1-like [Dorcoceras hygrometricum]